MSNVTGLTFSLDLLFLLLSLGLGQEHDELEGVPTALVLLARVLSDGHVLRRKNKQSLNTVANWSTY